MSNPPSDDQKRNWWTTLPGILSSFGGFIAALTGLLVALNQTGVLPVKTAPAVPTPSPGSAAAPTSNSAPTPQKTGDADPVLGLINDTRQIQVLGTTGCTDANSVMIRFKGDGSSGCAMYANTLRGTLESDVNVILVPVTAAGRGAFFDLLFVDEGARTRFLGILPGDGSGNLTVSLENGQIVERNGSREKRSTVRSGHVVPVKTAAAVALTPAVTTTTDAPTSSNDAADAEAAVREYYELWNARRLTDAYSLLSARYRAQHPYADWEASHASDFRITVQTSETRDPSIVGVTVHSTSRSGSTVTDNAYRGTWTVVHESGRVKLDSVTLTR